eukprot:TRINITY_DN34022_c0_g1_i1.p1 TRINITY_DN34022_c0_g1~~TRINITY_DN34022_c0_g1_i1.p1  ORF type:complete len:213 (+),score=62.47 TRINITY_DN34022_c0_g1_i1:41-679(+)
MCIRDRRAAVLGACEGLEEQQCEAVLLAVLQLADTSEGAPGKETQALRDQVTVLRRDNGALMNATLELTETIGALEKQLAQAHSQSSQVQKKHSEELEGLREEIEPLRVFEQASQELNLQLSEVVAERNMLEQDYGDLQHLQENLSLTWMPDSVADACVGCHENFSFTRRRHHCRFCGRIFCSSCTPQTAALPSLGYDSAVKICNWCSQIAK